MIRFIPFFLVLLANSLYFTNNNIDFNPVRAIRKRANNNDSFNNNDNKNRRLSSFGRNLFNNSINSINSISQATSSIITSNTDNYDKTREEALTELYEMNSQVESIYTSMIQRIVADNVHSLHDLENAKIELKNVDTFLGDVFEQMRTGTDVGAIENLEREVSYTYALSIIQVNFNAQDEKQDFFEIYKSGLSIKRVVEEIISALEKKLNQNRQWIKNLDKERRKVVDYLAQSVGINREEYVAGRALYTRVKSNSPRTRRICWGDLTHSRSDEGGSIDSSFN